MVGRNDIPADGEAAGDASNDELPTSVNDALPQFIGTAKDVMARYSHCVLCGANLHFTHITDFAKNLTQETGRCPECGIKTKLVIHRLQ